MTKVVRIKIWCCIGLIFFNVVQAVEVELLPHAEKIYEKDTITINGYLQLNDSEIEWKTGDIVLAATSTNGLIDIANASLVIAVDEVAEITNFTFVANVVEFGHEVFVLRAYSNAQNSNLTVVSQLRLRILRKQSVLDLIFLIILGGFLIINNINMGSILDIDEAKKVFKRPIGPIVGFGSQFLFMPLASYGVATLLIDNPSMRFGLFALGSSPGGTGSNFWTFLLGGDLQLSVVMTLVSTLAALGMMPMWLLTLGQNFLEESDVVIPFGQMLIPLASFILPVAIGILIRKKRPHWAAIIKKLFRPCTICLLLFILTVGMYTNLYLFRFFTWRLVLAGLIVAWGGFAFGALAAAVFCMKREQIIAISIETALQNAGIAFMLLKVSLPQPDADIGCVAPVAQLMLTGPVLWGSLLIYTVINCMRKPKDTDGENADSTMASIRKKLRLWSKHNEIQEPATDEKEPKQEILMKVVSK